MEDKYEPDRIPEIMTTEGMSVLQDICCCLMKIMDRQLRSLGLRELVVMSVSQQNVLQEVMD